MVLEQTEHVAHGVQLIGSFAQKQLLQVKNRGESVFGDANLTGFGKGVNEASKMLPVHGSSV